MLHAEFGRFRSNGTSAIKEIRLKNDPWRLAIQGHSRSSKPTRIDPPPMTSLTYHSNQGPVSYRFRDKRRFQSKSSKSQILLTHVFNALLSRVVFVGGSRGTSPSLDLIFPPTGLSENLGGSRNGKREGRERWKGRVGRPPALLPSTGFCLKYRPAAVVKPDGLKKLQ